ncbi:MAG: putative deoxyribonucleotide triphosphate pyrophosphatase [Osedax symbiont Rs2]|nr:MAG: putative deoxyribonucleotide triphosphate pyrophosphatase [Osedax symbiont Rs2]
MIDKIVLASSNKGKLKEFAEIFSAMHIQILPQSQFQVSDADETGLTFVENAILKARHACAVTGLPALADDSGLEVDALLGAPGIYSSRYSGAGDSANNSKLLEQLAQVPSEKRTARYRCALVFMRHAKDPTPLICQGTLEGSILTSARGEFGFGYDPLFLVEPELLGGRSLSAAQLTAEQKHKISHRGQAVADFVKLIDNYLR